MKILIADAFDKALPEKLKRFGEVTDDKNQSSSAEVILVRSATKVNKEYIDKSPALKFVIRGGVGVDNIDTKYAATKGIIVRNTPKASAIAVAELAFAMMAAVPSHLIKGHQGMKEGKFLKSELKRTELYNKTLCLVGTGNIGCELAKRAHAFGMKVVAYEVTGKCPLNFVTLKPSLAEAVEKANYVSLHTPLTDSTRGMINKSIIDKMADGAVIINTARDQCVATNDLCAALESGKISTYATDVWPSDPPPPEFPLLKAPNVLMLPHIGASTKENLGRIGEEVVALLEQYKKGDLK